MYSYLYDNEENKKNEIISAESFIIVKIKGTLVRFPSFISNIYSVADGVLRI